MQSTIYPYINTASVERLIGIVDRGLCSGLGNAADLVCVEAAWWLARGGDPAALSDSNECVGSSVRQFRISLNDALWSSPEARAAGMRDLAIAGLGSAHLPQHEFSKRVAVRFIREVLPIALRAAGSMHADPKHREALEKVAVDCETSTDLSAAAHAAAHAAADAAAHAADARAAAHAARDRVLSLSARIATEVLVEMGSEGAKFLERKAAG